MESLGASAIATTSSGTAWAHGYADGNNLPIEIHAATVREIARAVRVPITVDAEAGYSTDPKAVGPVIGQLIQAGAVGINIEDGFESPEITCAKIEAAKKAGVRAGIDLFVNSRTDVFLKQLAPGREVEEVLRRAVLYAGAGADGLFIPGAADANVISSIVRGTSMPVNVMARPGIPSLSKLRELGVRRLSAGSAIAQASLGLSSRLALGFLSAGATDQLFDGAMTYPDLNALMK